MLDFTQFKSILCLNGDLPSADFFNTHLPIIAADGAANTLMQMNIKPNIVIGDLDSVLPEYLQQIPSHYHYDQDFCDFEKSLQYLEANNLLPAIILGTNGGFLDHVLNNINIFIRSGCVLIAPPVCGFSVITPQTKRLVLPHDIKISLLGIPSATVSTTGLKWELDNATLAYPGNTSCFNRTVHENVTITLHDGHLLILVYADLLKSK